MALDQKVQDFLGGQCNLCARTINSENASLKKVVVILLRNDPASYHHDVGSALVFQRFNYSWH